MKEIKEVRKKKSGGVIDHVLTFHRLVRFTRQS